MPKPSLFAFLITLLLALLPARMASANGPLHTVQPGETLAAIASAYGLSAGELAAVNGLPQNGWLQPGQQLTLPTQPAMPYGAPPPAPLFNGFGNALPDQAQPVSQQYFAPAPPQFAAPSQTMPWTTIEPPPIPANTAQYASNSAWGQPAQNPAAGYFPPTAPSAPYYPAQSGQPAYPPAFNQPATAYQPYPTNQLYPPANPAPYWQPANNFNAAPPPRLNPALFTPNGEKWIDVNLSTQTLTALEGQTPMYRALVSTGLPDTPTVVGTYNIYIKHEQADMSGGSGAYAYNLKDVPYVMYFHGGYGLHGTYWHSNFGTPMSHGCVNLHTLDAAWLYNWAPVGTKLVTHY